MEREIHSQSKSTKELVWLDGEFLDFSSARVSVEDRGFLFGDGVYEVVRVYNGVPFSIEDHLARLLRSAAAIELKLSMGPSEFQEIIERLIHRSRLREAEVYIQVTRGSAPRLHLFPANASPTILLTVRPVRHIPPEFRQQGIKVETAPDERWARCDIKSICLLPNVLAKERAHRAGKQEAIFVREGLALEGTSSSLFILSGGEVVTPPADHRILAGVTRGRVLEVARERNYPSHERDIPLEELKTASEVFITSTVMEILPVVEVDDVVIGSGRPGRVFHDLYSAYRARLPK